MRGPAGAGARRCRGPRRAAAQAGRRRGGARAGAQGADPDHREPARADSGRRRCGRVQRRPGRTRAVASRSRRQCRCPAGRTARPAGRHRRRGDHRHDGPRLAQRPDRRRGGLGGAGRAARLRGCRRPTRQRVGGHRDRGRRRGGRGGRSGQGQIDRDAGGRRARAARHRRRLDGATTAAPRRGRPVLARHRRSPRCGPPAGPAAAQLGAPLRRRAGAAGPGRGRRGRGAHRAGPASHPAGALRLAADPGHPDPTAGPHERQVALTT